MALDISDLGDLGEYSDSDIRSQVSEADGKSFQSPPATQRAKRRHPPSTEDSFDSNDDMPRWCYEEGLASRATSSRKRIKTPQRTDSERSSEFKEMKDLLMKLCKKVDKNEQVLKEISNKCSSSSSSESDSSSKKKRCIPSYVRQEVRKTYNMLCSQEEDDFKGWIIEPGKTIKSPENDAVIVKLIKEVKGMNPSFNSVDIREAAYRYYKTKCEEESVKRRGKNEPVKISKRRHERIQRKRRERESAIKKNKKLSDAAREKWLKVVRNDFMSSEESEEDENTYLVHPIPWRSHYVNRMFEKIDGYCQHNKSSQARRQMKNRVVGRPSSRPRPSEELPDWAITGE